MTVQSAIPYKLKTRFYNEIRLFDGKIRKLSSHERIQTEAVWFNEAAKLIPQHVPRIYAITKDGSSGILDMEYIEADNLYHQYREGKTPITRDSILSEIAVVRSKMYKSRSAPDRKDIHEMYLNKPLAALRYLYEKMPQLDAVIAINGNECRPPITLLPVLYARLEQRLLRTNYSFIHGDLTLSNMAADKNGRIFMFDPRGKFGSSPIVGDTRYDTAKLFFSCIANFDALNNHAFSVKQSVDKKHFSYIIEDVLPGCDKTALFWEAFPDDHAAVEFINCSIWLSLFPHLQESDEQTLTAYLHGVYMLDALSRSLE